MLQSSNIINNHDRNELKSSNFLMSKFLRIYNSSNFNNISKIADLFLYWYEHNYISEAIGNPNLQAIIYILKYCSRYIDDLIIPNALKPRSL